MPVDKSRAQCTFCLKHMTRRNLHSHMRNVHNTSFHTNLALRIKNVIDCPLCEEQGVHVRVASYADYVEHCSDVHAVDESEKSLYTMVEKHFSDKRSYEKWLGEMCSSTCTSFVRRTSTAHGRQVHMRCNREGIYESKGTQRLCSSKKAIKHCTAHLVVTTNHDGSLKARGCFVHIGHDLDPARLRRAAVPEDSFNDTVNECCEPRISPICPVVCPECVRPMKRDNVGEHAAFAHKYTNRERQILLLYLGVEVTFPIPELNFKCDHCSSSFDRKFELSLHLDEEHADQNPSCSTTGTFVCFFDGCGQSYDIVEEFVKHCASKHSMESHQEFEVFNEFFSSADEFLAWKAGIEEKTCTSFRRRSSDNQTTEYECHWVSFIDQKEGSQTKKCRTQDRRCTAFIKSQTRSDGSVEVIGCTDHVGHPKSAEKLLLTSRQKEELRGLIAEGLQPAEIIEKMKEKYDSSSRMHYLVSSDIMLLANPPAEKESGSLDEIYICTECNEGPMTIKKLRSHTLEVHENYRDGDKECGKTEANDMYYSCGSCGYICFTELLLDAHLQRYHPSIGALKTMTPVPEAVTCPKCQMVFKTRYHLAVHCVSSHSSSALNSFIVQTSFLSWTQFEPWLEKMENDTDSVLVKSGMQAFGTKLVHTYNCQFDKAVQGKAVGSSTKRTRNDCAAFVKVIENEDGVLDCVGFFGHIGHDGAPQGSEHGANKDGDGEEVCFICGYTEPPEVDAEICDDVKWLRCNEETCGAPAHEWCVELMGRRCTECGNGMLTAGLQKDKDDVPLESETVTT